MTTTRLRVAVKNGDKAITVMTAEHGAQPFDSCRPGPSIGPFMVSEGGVYFWLNGEHRGEPVAIGVGQSIVITCEVDS